MIRILKKTIIIEHNQAEFVLSIELMNDGYRANKTTTQHRSFHIDMDRPIGDLPKFSLLHRAQPSSLAFYLYQ